MSILEQIKSYYKIADLILELRTPNVVHAQDLLPNFKEFEVNEVCEPITTQVIVEIQHQLDFVKESYELLSDISIVWGDRFRFYKDDNEYVTVVEDPKSGAIITKMQSTMDFYENKIQLCDKNVLSSKLLSWCCMVAFAQSSLRHKAVLIHASTVEEGRNAYAFLGKSGTGKSTHSRLWLERFKDFNLLNDDNPVIRLFDNGLVKIYGTPWSGKTPCYQNKSRILDGVVRLSQSNVNKFALIKDKEALIALLPSCSAIRWNIDIYSKLVDILLELINCVRVGYLKCLPNLDAAELCHKNIVKYEKLYE